MLDLAAALETLREANSNLGWTAYQWQTLSCTGSAVAASNGVLVPVDNTIEANGPRTNNNKTNRDKHRDKHWVFVCADADLADADLNAVVPARLLLWLQKLDRTGARLGAIGGGTFVLAKADIIRGRRCTIHWQSAPWLCEHYPGINPNRRVFEIDRGLYTCSGGTAVTDLFVRLIAERHGWEITEGLSAQFQLERVRTHDDEQRSVPLAQLSARPRKLQSAIREMEGTLEMPVSPEAIAHRVGVTTRHLQRLFRAHTGISPARFYMDLRLRQARLLLQQTRMPVLEVAVAVGFSSHSHFSKRYRERYGRTPQQERAARRKMADTGFSKLVFA